MAEHLSRAADRVFTKGATILVALLAGALAHAQALVDPTRPPATIESSGERETSADSGPVLQSVLISPSRKIAIINGQMLKLGDKFGEARVARITENEVVLRNGQQMQTLKLFPQVEKQAASGLNHPKAGSRQRSR